MAVVGGDARGCSPNRKPPDSPKATGEPTGRPMEETEVAREVDSPSETVAVVDLDKMPPLEEDEAIAELDAAIDKAGDDGEEGPEPLDEADIREVAQCIKDDPMLHLTLGLTESYWASMTSAVEQPEEKPGVILRQVGSSLQREERPAPRGISCGEAVAETQEAQGQTG